MMVPTILVVEDDDVLRESLADSLSEDGYDVETASNGVEALERLRDGHPHPALILLDLMMPRMNGWQFRSVQREDPALKGIPVIILSAAGNAGETVAPLSPAAFVRKPFDLDALLATVHQITPT